MYKYLKLLNSLLFILLISHLISAKDKNEELDKIYSFLDSLVVKNIINNWVYPKTLSTETALTWLQDYVTNIQQGNSVSLTGDETKHKNEQI